MNLPPDGGARLTTRVAARTVHDLNNIATVLSGHIYLLRSAAEPPEEGYDAMEAAMETLKKLTASLCSLAALGVGEREPVRINELVQSAMAALPPGRSVELELDPAVKEIRLRPGDVARALDALLANGAEASEPGQPLRVSTRQGPDGSVEIRVEDSGGGVPEEIRRRNFDPFFTTRGVKGRGIGVTVAATAAALESGSLQIENRPGGGTTATLRLRGEAQPAPAT